FWAHRDGVRAAGRRAVPALLAVAVVITPWTVRNAVEMNALVPLTTSVGINLRIGHSPDAPGRLYWPDGIEPTDGPNTIFHAEQPEDEVERGRIYTRRAIDYALTHPVEELALAGKKLSWLFHLDPDQLVSELETQGATPLEPEGIADQLPAILYGSHYALLALAAIAVPFWLHFRNSGAVLLVSLVALWAAFHVVFFAEPRFLLPLLPLFAISAGWLLARAAGALPLLLRRPQARTAVAVPVRSEGKAAP
ncbi:MAG: hypothetical protein Q8S13_00365, partial [Dehalococcoidia bacterium]|nr:hypothetical protein [Dehalococcoidia bacterium]